MGETRLAEVLPFGCLARLRCATLAGAGDEECREDDVAGDGGALPLRVEGFRLRCAARRQADSLAVRERAADLRHAERHTLPVVQASVAAAAEAEAEAEPAAVSVAECGERSGIARAAAECLYRTAAALHTSGGRDDPAPLLAMLRHVHARGADADGDTKLAAAANEQGRRKRFRRRGKLPYAAPAKADAPSTAPWVLVDEYAAAPTPASGTAGDAAEGAARVMLLPEHLLAATRGWREERVPTESPRRLLEAHLGRSAELREEAARVLGGGDPEGGSV